MNLTDFHFIRPYYLLAFIPFLLLIIFLVKNKLNQNNWQAVCDESLLPYLVDNKSSTKSHWVMSSLSLAAFLTIVALSGPTWEKLPTPSFRYDAALVVALDLSATMNSQDIKPSRLIRARYKIRDILSQRKDGLTALVVYSGDAFTVTPLTNDVATISNQLSALTTDIMPSEGKNTQAAITLAHQLLQQAGQQQGDVFLITDGVGNYQSAQQQTGYRLSVLAVGTQEGAPVKLSTGGFLKDNAGNIVVPSLDVKGLKKLAHSEKGDYQDLTVDDNDIEALLKSVDMPNNDLTTKQKGGFIEQWEDKGPWLLLLVLPLAVLSFRKGLLVVVLMVLLPLPQPSYAIDWNDIWSTQDQQAQQDFDNKNYEQAAKKFTSPAWKAAAEYKAERYEQAAKTLSDTKTADSFYNQGNALAQTGQLAAAKKAYKQALKLKPDDKDAQYNLELVEKALAQQQSQKDQQDKNDQQGGSPKDQQANNNDQSSGNSQQQKKQGQNKSDEQGEPSPDSQNEQQQQEKAEQEKIEQGQESAASQSESKQAENDDSLKDDAEKTQAISEAKQDEGQQASEQWLKRIHDDPAGLLKRKFKYQYRQRNNGH